jgi:hypothetical protein
MGGDVKMVGIIGWFKRIICFARVCLKIAFCQMCVTVCGRFVPNEGGVVGYVN